MSEKCPFDASDARQGKCTALSGVLYEALRQIDAQTCKIRNPFLYIHTLMGNFPIIYINIFLNLKKKKKCLSV